MSYRAASIPTRAHANTCQVDARADKSIRTKPLSTGVSAAGLQENETTDSLSMRPLLFLDVDGVLNCLMPSVDHEYVQPDPEGLIACVPKGTRERLAQLLPVYDTVWATAWRGVAHPHFRAYLELPAESWPYLDYEGYKLTSILRYAKGRPWAWIDDDAEIEIRNLGDHFRDLPDSLVITPHGRLGITDDHVRQLLAFAEQYTED